MVTQNIYNFIKNSKLSLSQNFHANITIPILHKKYDHIKTYHGKCKNENILTSLQKNNHRKVPKFSDARKLCCKLPKFNKKRPNHMVLHQKDANGIANSEDPLGAV